MNILFFIPVFLWSLAPIIGYFLKNTHIISTLVYLFLFAWIYFAIHIFYKIIFTKHKYNWIPPFNFYLYIFFLIIGIVIYTFSYYYGISHYNPIEINTLNYLWGVFIPFISIFLLSKKDLWSNYDYGVLLIGFLSVTFTTNVWENLSNFHIGHFLMILGAFFTALNTVLILKMKEKFENLNTEFIYFHILGIISLSFISILFVFDDNKLFVTSSEIIKIFILGFVVFGASRPLWYYLLNNYNKTKLLSVSFLTPVLGNLWLILFTHSPIYFNTIIGFLLILLTLFLNTDFIKAQALSLFIKK